MYNVSAIVANTPSWWIFTTSSQPSQKIFSNTQLSFSGMLVGLTVATVVTLIVSLLILMQRMKHSKMVSNRAANTSNLTSNVVEKT
jgi:mannitol-specific phosphotransferase system IIBC component